MKKGDIIRGVVERTDFPNKGMLKVEDYRVTVKNGLVGQTIEFAVQKKRNGCVQGRLLQVIEPSGIETRTPECPHFGICGGCSYQTIPYEEQLNLKKEQVRRLIQAAVAEGIDPPTEDEILASPTEWAYRNKMEFSFGDEVKDGPLALGLHKKGSFYDIVTTNQCKIIHSDYCMILEKTLEFFASRNITYYHKMRHEGYLRHLLIRRTTKTKQLLVSLVTTSMVPEGCSREQLDLEYLECLKALPLEAELKSVSHIINDGLADVVRSDETIQLLGADYIEEEILGLKFKISTFSFFQTNSLGAEVLYGRARDYILSSQSDRSNLSDRENETGLRDDECVESADKSNQNHENDKNHMTSAMESEKSSNSGKKPVIFDLYSGTGTIAQLLAPVAKKVIGVEIVEEAVEAAKENAKLNGLDNCEFIAGDVLKVLDDIDEKPDLIVLDPPRDGIHPKALKKITAYGVKQMIYISCKPTSLARDLELLQEGGYQLVKYGCVDMFCQGPNVETVCLLSKLHEAKHHVSVKLDMDEMDLTSAESKATYEEIKAYVAEHNDGMKISSLYIAQVKRKCGIELAENYNLPKSEDSKQPSCPKEKEDAIMEALKAFQMI